MLAKCITPKCHSHFKYFGRGVLMVKKFNGGYPPTDAELFWMCEDCAQIMAAPSEFVVLSRSREASRAKGIAA